MPFSGLEGSQAGLPTVPMACTCLIACFMPTLACKTGEKACGVSVSIKVTGSKAQSSLEVLES